MACEEGVWQPTLIEDDGEVLKCTGCGELLVIFKYKATGYPPGTKPSVALADVRRRKEMNDARLNSA